MEGLILTLKESKMVLPQCDLTEGVLVELSAPAWFQTHLLLLKG